jgi:hypothetical protein
MDYYNEESISIGCAEQRLGSARVTAYIPYYGEF